MSEFPRASTICHKCGVEAMNFLDEAIRFYKVCLHCGSYSPRLCPHDGVKCEHECEREDCWRELEGS